MATQTVSLREFIQNEKLRLEAFERYWLEMNAQYPEHFPMELPIQNAGVWDEQFATYDFEKSYDPIEIDADLDTDNADEFQIKP